MNRFLEKGLKIGDMVFITPRQTAAMSGEDIVFLDIRPDYETVGKRIVVKELVFIPWDRFREDFVMLDPARSIVILDAVGLHSKEAVRFLMDHGFQHVAGLAGGFVDWERDGMPVDIGRKEMLTGSCVCTLRPKERFL